MVWLLGAVTMAASADPVRLALLPFGVEPGAETNHWAVALAESALLADFSQQDAVALVERAALDRLLEEQAATLAERDGVAQWVPLSGAEALLLGWLSGSNGDWRMRLTLVETASGNLLLEETRPFHDGGELVEQCAEFALQAVAKLAELRVGDLRPGVALIEVRTFSPLAQHRLQSSVGALWDDLEAVVAARPAYRLLRRRRPYETRLESEMALAGWTRDDPAVRARAAAVALGVELIEFYEPGRDWSGTPVRARLIFMPSVGALRIETVDGLAGDLAGWRRAICAATDRVLTELEGLAPISAAEDRTREAWRIFEWALGADAVRDLITASGHHTPPSDFTMGEIERDRFSAEMAAAPALTPDNSHTILMNAHGPQPSPRDRLLTAEILERVLQLDPMLALARLELARHYAGAEERAYHRRAAAAYDIFLASQPHIPLSPKEQKALMRRQYGRESYISLRLIVLEEAAGYLYLLNRDKYTSAVREYILTPPMPRTLPDDLQYVGFILMRARDFKGLAEWYEFLNEIYGARHDEFNVDCPLIMHADCLNASVSEDQRKGKAADDQTLPLRLAAALELVERAKREHGDLSVEKFRMQEEFTRHDYKYTDAEDRLRIAAGLEPMDYRLANGQRRRAPEEEMAVDWAPALKHIPGLPCEPVLRPSDLTPPRQGMQEYGSLMAVGGPDPALTFWGGSRDQYVLTRGELNCTSWLPLVTTSQPARVTKIMTVDKNVWLLTPQGLLQYRDDGKMARWWTAEDGLPETNLVSGCVKDGVLWLGGRVVFSLDLQSGHVRTYQYVGLAKPRRPLDCGPGFNSYDSLHFVDRFLCALLGDRPYALDPEQGQWMPIENKGITAAPTQWQDRLWIGTPRGLTEVLATTTNLVLGLPQALPPIVDLPPLVQEQVTALTADQHGIWLLSTDVAVARNRQSKGFVRQHRVYFIRFYDPAEDVWRGPWHVKQLDGRSADGRPTALQAQGDSIWILGAFPQRFHAADLLTL